MSRPWRYGDVVEWDVPADPPHQVIRWMIVAPVEDTSFGWYAVWVGGGAPQHWESMAGLKRIGAMNDDPGNRLLTDE